MKDYFGPIEEDEVEDIYKRPKINSTNFEGQRFGFWLVGSKYDAKYKYWCTCDCGNKTIRNINQLRLKGTSRCAKCYKSSKSAVQFKSNPISPLKKNKL